MPSSCKYVQADVITFFKCLLWYKPRAKRARKFKEHTIEYWGDGASAHVFDAWNLAACAETLRKPVRVLSLTSANQWKWAERQTFKSNFDCMTSNALSRVRRAIYKRVRTNLLFVRTVAKHAMSNTKLIITILWRCHKDLASCSKVPAHFHVSFALGEVAWGVLGWLPNPCWANCATMCYIRLLPEISL